MVARPSGARQTMGGVINMAVLRVKVSVINNFLHSFMMDADSDGVGLKALTIRQ